MSTPPASFMQQALDLARHGIEQGHGGPFGAIVVVENQIVGRGWNQVIQRNDPTAHAEVLAIRSACEALGRFHLEGATLYATCEPCPMCLGALYWAHIEHLVYAATAEDAAAFGFDDYRIRQALQQPLTQQPLQLHQHGREASLALFQQWQTSSKRIDY